ncbi:MAG: hypothetical protein KDD52_03235 [Bdellovibrionales bacterium]|nr:hypothetical protein [Bdellovibrionales bacterium]
MKTKLFLGAALVVAFLGVFAGQAHAQIEVVVDDEIEGTVDPAYNSEAQWFEVRDADENLIIKLDIRKGSLRYELCKHDCSSILNVKMSEYKNVKRLVAREFFFRETNKGETAILRLYKDKNGTIFNIPLGQSNWRINFQEFVGFEYDDQGTGVSILIR